MDPDTLLEWLSSGHGEDNSVQLVALEQLCMTLLMSDNVDRCFERYVSLLGFDLWAFTSFPMCSPLRSQLPAPRLPASALSDLPRPERHAAILEVTARALTYYLDVSTECTHRIVGVEGAVAAIASRISPPDETEESARARIEEPNVKDLVEQCVKACPALALCSALFLYHSFVHMFSQL